MATTDVTIINGALRKIGVQEIVLRTDETEQGRVSNSTYDLLLDAVLVDAPWDFAITRAEITAEDTGPDFEYDNYFELPDGDPDLYCLRPLEIINLTQYQWKVEGRNIATSHESPLQLIYVARIVDEEVYTPQFIEALQARLALEWAEPLTRQSSIQQVMAALYERKITDAKAVEAGQTGLHEDTDEGTWVTSRFG